MITKNPSIPIFDIGPKTRVIDFFVPFFRNFQNFEKIEILKNHISKTSWKFKNRYTRIVKGNLKYIETKFDVSNWKNGGLVHFLSKKITFLSNLSSKIAAPMHLYGNHKFENLIIRVILGIFSICKKYDIQRNALY